MKRALDSITRLRDSLQQAKLKIQKELKDTIDVEEQPDLQLKKQPTPADTNKPATKDTSRRTAKISPAILLPEERKVKKNVTPKKSKDSKK